MYMSLELFFFSVFPVGLVTVEYLLLQETLDGYFNPSSPPIRRCRFALLQ